VKACKLQKIGSTATIRVKLNIIEGVVSIFSVHFNFDDI